MPDLSGVDIAILPQPFVEGVGLERSMTQERLAADLDLSVDFLSLMERGCNAPSFETLEKLAVALEVPVWQLFRFSGADDPRKSAN